MLDLSYNRTWDTCQEDSTDPRRHVWQTNTLPPQDKARCLCGQFNWETVRDWMRQNEVIK